MRKQTIGSFVGLLLAGMGGQAFAQQQGWQGGIALPHALQNLEEWTNQPLWGLCLDGAYQMAIPESKSSLRLGLGVNWLPGREGSFSYFAPSVPRTISLTGIQLNADVVMPIGASPFSVVTGVSLNTWMKSVSGKSGYAQNLWDGTYGDGGRPNIVTHPAGTRDNSVSGAVGGAFGRFGLRFGFDYALSDSITLSALFQIVELGTDGEFLAKENKRTDSVNSETLEVVTTYIANVDFVGKNTVNPSWIQFGARFRF